MEPSLLAEFVLTEYGRIAQMHDTTVLLLGRAGGEK
jgi:hypothetical protein